MTQNISESISSSKLKPNLEVVEHGWGRPVSRASNVSNETDTNKVAIGHRPKVPINIHDSFNSSSEPTLYATANGPINPYAHQHHQIIPHINEPERPRHSMVSQPENLPEVVSEANLNMGWVSEKPKKPKWSRKKKILVTGSILLLICAIVGAAIAGVISAKKSNKAPKGYPLNTGKWDLTAPLTLNTGVCGPTNPKALFTCRSPIVLPFTLLKDGSEYRISSTYSSGGLGGILTPPQNETDLYRINFIEEFLQDGCRSYVNVTVGLGREWLYDLHFKYITPEPCTLISGQATARDQYCDCRWSGFLNEGRRPESFVKNNP